MKGLYEDVHLMSEMKRRQSWNLEDEHSKKKEGQMQRSFGKFIVFKGKKASVAIQ